MKHSERLRLMAEASRYPSETWSALVSAAQYIENLEAGIDEHRQRREIQQTLRIEAQARAARLSRDARR